MHKLLIILLPLTLLAIPARAQTKITWETLADVTFTDEYIEEVGAWVYFPEFGASVKALDGKEVTLKGYILAIEPEEGFYVLSRYPMASCFFCGAGGPESVVELNMKAEGERYKMDQVLTIKGTLTLNEGDIYHCSYILKNAEPH